MVGEPFHPQILCRRAFKKSLSDASLRIKPFAPALHIAKYPLEQVQDPLR